MKKEIPFVHLHNHSDYSLRDGAVKIDWYIKEARKYGMKHLGLTDHNNLFGAYRFEQACHGAGINPVIGCEMTVRSGGESYHLVLYCKNEEGYRNLMVLVSRGYTDNPSEPPHVTDQLLKEYHGGLICSSGCSEGEIPRLILKGDLKGAREKALHYRDLFGEGNFYLEIMDHGREEEKEILGGILRISRETGIPVIATNDVHYLIREHSSARNILSLIDSDKRISDNVQPAGNSERYFKSPEEMKDIFSNCPEALSNTVELAEKCYLTIPQPGIILPEFAVPHDFESKQQYLHHLVFLGLQKRYEELTSEIRERAEYELRVINSCAFEDYFLIVWDYVSWAHRQDIPVGPGRGSCPGSLVTYALGITGIDPLKYGLLFERFLNPERCYTPVIDLDFCFERRQEVMDYVSAKYGRGRVAGISTFSSLGPRYLIGEIARILGISSEEASAITDRIPFERPPRNWRKKRLEYYLEQIPELHAFYERGAVYRELFDMAARLEGVICHVSTHTCGKVIGRTELTDYCPLCIDRETGEINTQFNPFEIESCGPVRLNFLGLKTLTLLKKTEALVRRSHPEFYIDRIPEDDKATFKMLSRGDSTDVFQFESPGMKQILKEARPDCMEDLIALNALYRPGPLQFIPRFIEGKHDPSTITYPDPGLKTLLEPTYGVIVYQEQVMEIARIIAGFSLGKGDVLRRALGKKKMKDIEKLRAEFMAGARERGHSEEHGAVLFEMLEPFCCYGFNKSHAAAYTMIGYRAAYCKAHYPEEFEEAIIPGTL